MIEHAALKDKIVFIGMSQKFQIWDAERFAPIDAERIARMKSAREREIAKLAGGGT
jgi:DNA-binding transcriptional regulator/RsmH inhibitor MraZ